MIHNRQKKPDPQKTANIANKRKKNLETTYYYYVLLF